MSENRKREYEEKADDARVVTIASNAKKHRLLCVRIQETKTQIPVTPASSKPVRLSSCNLTATDKISSRFGNRGASQPRM
jgi:hypothetical protein